MDNKRKIKRNEMPEQKPSVRIHNFKEVPFGYSMEIAQLEASRCLQCKKPLCMEGCPVNVDIPDFIKHVKNGDISKAIEILWTKNSFPAICGRVCPQDNQCEKKCILSKKDKSVAIGNLERFVADWAILKNNTPKKPIIKKTNKNIAIVGSGPGGLTVAGDLIRKGHNVTIFEAFHELGGVLVYGIPEFRLPKKIVAHEISFLEHLGAKFKKNTVIGHTFTIDELLNEEGFDAIYLGVGAGLPRFFGIPGENLMGIYSANEYLTRSNLMKAYLFPKYDTSLSKGENVVVFGGGNVAMDTLRTAKRIGSKNVTCVYRRSYDELPARSEEIRHTKEENIEFLMLQSPLRFIGNKDGWLKAVELQEMQLGEPDSDGRRKPSSIKGKTKIIKCDIAIIAIGSGANPLITSTTPDLTTNEQGYITTDKFGKTKKNKVWAGGDIVTGSATVISAAGAGRIAAQSIHKFLTWGW